MSEDSELSDLSTVSQSVVLGVLSPQSSFEKNENFPVKDINSGFDEKLGTHKSRNVARRPIFIFVNPVSGGNTAGTWINSSVTRFETEEPVATIQLFDIRKGNSGKKEGFLLLKELSASWNEQSSIISVAAGGDGTVMWMVSEMWAHEVDISKVVVGVIPYGTGNDFARSLSWNRYNAAKPFEQNMKVLKQLLIDWVHSPITLHDVWEIDIELYDGGEFRQVDSSTRKKTTILDNHRCPVLRKKIMMNNYFSVGVESRVGIGFDKRRTKSQFRNKMVYGTEGLKKMVFKNTTPVDGLVERMIESSEQNERVIFDSNAPGDIHPNLKQTKSLIAVNIPSFASGIDLWGATKGKKDVAVQFPFSVGLDEISDLQKAPQKLGDKKLEFLTFPSLLSLSAEQVVSGNAKRLCQGNGPFVLEFREQLLSKERIYFQVDGEFFLMYSPKKLTIRHHEQISVLVSPDAPEKGSYTFCE